MDEIQFIFQVSELDEQILVPQIKAAMQLRMKLQQESLPKLLRKAAEKRTTPEACEAAAREFIKGHVESLKEQGNVQICFSDEEMITVMGDLEDLDQEAITYDEMGSVYETEDIFFVLYHQNRGMPLQKKDLDLEMGSVDEFRAFLQQKGRRIINVTAE